MNDQVMVCFDQIPLIQDLGFHVIRQYYTHPNRKLDWNVFLYVTEGQMEVFEEGTEYVVQKGQFLFLKSNLKHWGEPKTPANTSWYWIHFYDTSPTRDSEELNVYANSLQTYSISSKEYSRFIRLPKQGTISNPAVFENKLEFLLEQFKLQNNPFRAITLSLQVMELFVMLYQESMKNRPLTKSDYTVSRIIEYLKQKETYELNAKELEEYFHMNYSYLCDAFKNKTGSTIHLYHMQNIINKAVKMMRSSDKNISEISDTLGFQNAYYFSRVFKKVMNFSPSEYRSKIYPNSMNS